MAPRKNVDGNGKKDFEIVMPKVLVLLCRLLHISEEKLLQDFINTMSLQSHPDDIRRQLFINQYIIENNYGQPHYSKPDVLKMLNELHTVTTLFPNKSSEPKQDEAWREKLIECWFEKWQK
jgi:hypothetical protein